MRYTVIINVGLGPHDEKTVIIAKEMKKEKERGALGEAAFASSSFLPPIRQVKCYTVLAFARLNARRRAHNGLFISALRHPASGRSIRANKLGLTVETQHIFILIKCVYYLFTKVQQGGRSRGGGGGGREGRGVTSPSPPPEEKGRVAPGVHSFVVIAAAP